MANEVAGDGVTFNMLLPGRIETDRLKELDAANAKRTGRSLDEVAHRADGEAQSRHLLFELAPRGPGLL